MENQILVDYENCREVAEAIVAVLKGKTFSVVSVYTNKLPKPESKVIRGLRLYDDLENPIPEFDPQIGYRLDDGLLSIPLSPRRMLKWDLKTEKVTVVLNDDGYLTIEREMPHGLLIRIAIES